MSASLPLGSPRAVVALREATSAWPGIALKADRFCALFDRLSETAGGEALALHGNDLYLALASLDGDPTAQNTLKTLVAEQAARLSHFRLSSGDLDDLKQRTLAMLLVGDSPKLTSYGGRGPLAGWLHVLMTREVIDRLRVEHREVPVDDDVLLGLPDEGLDVDLESLKAKYRGQFSSAFRVAIGRLTARQRNMLRQHYLDDLSLEELGDLYRVHRATAARWLADAREQVLSSTRDEISQATGIPRLEVDSLMRIVQSRLDMSAGLFLTAERRTPTGSDRS